MFTCLAPKKLGINLPWPQTANLAAEAGFDAIEVALNPQQPVDDIRRVLDECRLKPGGVIIPPAEWRGDQKVFDDMLTQLPSRAAQLVALGSTRFHTWLLPWSDTLPYRENHKLHVERLGAAARILADHGCTLAIEFVGPRSARIGHRYPFIHTMEQAIDLCAAVGPNANLLLDSWHWHASLGTAEDLRALAAQQVGYVHLNDAPDGVPIDQLIDTERRLPASTGAIDIGAFIAELRRLNYNGPIVAEPMDASLAKLEPLDAAKRGLAALRQAITTEPKPALPATMQVIATGGKQARIVEQPVPRPVGHQVVVKMHASLICGSNMHQFFGDQEKINGGHEGAGEVVAVAQSNLLRVGDRVALAPLTACGRCAYCRRGDIILCRSRPRFDGNFAQYSLVADTVCIKLPDDVSYEHGSLLGCGLGPAYAAMKTLGVRAFDTLVIAGLGPVGLGTCALASFMGVRVLGIDPEPYRRAVATKLGAAMTFDGAAADLAEQLRTALGPAGLLKGVDSSGQPDAERMLIDLAAPHASIAFIGENKSTIPVSPSHDMIRKCLAVHGVWHMNMNDAGDLLTFLRRCPDKADLLLTHRFSFSQSQEAFETFASRQAVKVALCPSH